MPGNPAAAVSRIGGRIRLAFTRRPTVVAVPQPTAATPTVHDIESVGYVEDLILAEDKRLKHFMDDVLG